MVAGIQPVDPGIDELDHRKKSLQIALLSKFDASLSNSEERRRNFIVNFPPTMYEKSLETMIHEIQRVIFESKFE